MRSSLSVITLSVLRSISMDSAYIRLKFCAMFCWIFDVDVLFSRSLDGLLMVLLIGLPVFLMHLHQRLTLPYG